MSFEFNPHKAGNYLFAVKYYKGTTVLSKLFSSLRYVGKRRYFLLYLIFYNIKNISTSQAVKYFYF